MSSYAVTRYERPKCYIGATHYNWFNSGVSQHRDSDALERANFEAMLKLLGGESDTVEVIRERHFLVGWVEWIKIKGFKAVRTAVDACNRLNDYPCLSDDLWSELEDKDCCEVWEKCYDRRERLEYIRDHVRHDIDLSMLKDAARGDWYAASNLLPCPSDLLH